MKTLIIIGLIISIIFGSSIMISVEEFKIDNLYSLKLLIKSIMNRNFEESLECFNVLIYIRIYVLNIIPINIFKIDNKFIKKILLKRKNKNNRMLKSKDKKSNLNRINIFRKQKNISNNISKHKKMKSSVKIEGNIKLKDVTINELKINMNVDMKSSYNTSIVATIINILLSYLYTFLFEKCNMKNPKKCQYIITPEFGNQDVFYLKIKTKVSMNILTILLRLKMYKLKLNVNNTNKFKVKETIQNGKSSN